MNPSVGAALTLARSLGLDRLDAQLLLAHALARSRTWLLAHDEHALAAPQARAFELACRRRAAGEPLAYLLGEREFHGLRLRVTPAVLVPRPDTETLVDWALELLAADFATTPAPQVADLGSGSGAIALALKHRHPGADVCAVELDAAALEVALANSSRVTGCSPWPAGAITCWSATRPTSPPTTRTWPRCATNRGTR
jgi:release factor glutamine methyltransferase